MKRFLTLFMALMCSVTALAIAPAQTEQNPQSKYEDTLFAQDEQELVAGNADAAEKEDTEIMPGSIEAPTEQLTRAETNINAQFTSKEVAPKTTTTTNNNTPNNVASTENSSQNQPSNSSGNQIIATITHYCACTKCNGKYSYTDSDGSVYCSTAGGVTLHNGRDNGNYCAANFGKIGDRITIKGITYTIIDRFGNSSGSPKVDIFVSEGHSSCMQKGRQAGVQVTLH